MSSLVCNALHIDEGPLEGKLILVEEGHGSDGNFVLNCIISHQVKQNCGLCFVMVHNTLGHYHTVGMKLGYNLRSLVEHDYCVPIELLQNCVLSNDRREAEPFLSLLSKNKQSVLKSLFTLIEQSVKKLSEKRDSVCLVIDDLSDFLSLGFELKDVWSFFQYCRTLLIRYPKLSLTILSHVANNDSDQRTLVVSMAHVSDIHVVLSSLTTGKCRDISGLMKINWRNLDDVQCMQQWNKQSSYHYKLEDRQVKMFAPGTGSRFV